MRAKRSTEQQVSISKFVQYSSDRWRGITPEQCKGLGYFYVDFMEELYLDRQKQMLYFHVSTNDVQLH